MPRRLRERWRPESTRELLASAQHRFDEGLALAGQGQRTGAIYLWGYCAEMTLKAAYFRLTGLAPTDIITWTGQVQPAIQRGRTFFVIAWPPAGQGHNVRAWAELLIAERAQQGVTYPAPFGQQVQRCGQRIAQLWSESLRYHSNIAYLYEVTQVREAAEWLLAHAHDL